jgi:type I restriction enzyme S subunit
MKTREEVLQIVARARLALEGVYGERLRGVYLFGSFARGEAQEDSDVDIAVVLDEIPHRFAEIERTGDLASDLTLEYGTLVTLFFVPEEDFKQGRHAVHRAIKREGVPA